MKLTYLINPPFANRYKRWLFKLGVLIIVSGIIASLLNIGLFLMIYFVPYN